MIPFFVKTTIILTLAYVFYYFLLRKSHSFVFIRFYFLFALTFAIIIPFIELPVQPRFSFMDDTLFNHFATLEMVEGGEDIPEVGTSWKARNTILIIYILGSGIMFFRFARNLIKLLMKVKPRQALKENRFYIYLIEDSRLPYSFFKHIFLNRLAYERGDVQKELLIHEEAHSKQYHSLDVLFAELAKIILWFNPFAWLIERAIRLNHEYLADEEVLSSKSINEYQLLLISMVLGNESISLASAFNNSLIKQRLAMMNTIKQGKKEIFQKLSVIPLFLFLALGLSYCEADQIAEENPENHMGFYANDWWKPILERHQITPSAYNNFEFIFEMGSTNSIDENRVVTLSDAFFLVRKDTHTYAILRSPLATHNLGTGVISGAEGMLETYDMKQKNLEPVGLVEMKNFKYQLVHNKHEVRADYMVLYEQGKQVMKGWTGDFEARDSLVIDRME